METMKAVRIHRFGGPEVLTIEEVPRPRAERGEALIRVMATAVNPFDCTVHAGRASAYLKRPLPLIIGTDVSGKIVEVGTGATGISKGDEVYGRADISRGGANAEFVAARASAVAAKPATLDHVHAAALPQATLAAWQALIEMADIREGQTVLIHGAAGGVGHIAVQLAHWRGARVIGTASANLDLLQALRVETAIDYSRTRFEDVVNGVDVVLDTVGGDALERSFDVLKPDGILISTVRPPSEELAKQRGIRAGMVMSTPPIRETLTKVAELVDRGLVRPEVSAMFPLAEVRKAHEMIESRHARGKIVLSVAAA